MEWDEFTDLATAAYILYQKWHPWKHPSSYMPLNQLMAQARRYLSTEEGMPDLEALQNLLQMTTMQI